MNWAIVVAAGRGERFGQPKQFAELEGERIIDRAVDAARRSCDAVVLVLAPGIEWDGAPVDAVVVGGVTRSDSVRAGLAAVPDDAEIVVVHDAARPLASSALFEAVIAATCGGADAAVPGVALVDTVKRVDGARVRETVPREELVAVQTPQAFRAVALRAAHVRAPDASDDAALVEAGGGVVLVVEGDPRNVKITTPDDLMIAEVLLRSEAGSR